MDGLLAINKPTGMSSAQVIRNLQKVFNKSQLFAPSLQAAKLAQNSDPNQRHRRKRRPIQVKIGHGGTLDPMATGVLILGIGNGTKQLQNFLACKKMYEATFLFGAATDTYDVLGQVVKRAPFSHITQKKVDDSLSSFRGAFKQKPPIYSARWIDGKRLYEYAREGKTPPRDIESRPVQVDKLELLEWSDSASFHGNLLPASLAQGEEALKDEANVSDPNPSSHENQSNLKRPAPCDDPADERPAKRLEASEDLPAEKDAGVAPTSQLNFANTVDLSKISNGPTAKLRMTVSSGFYVRSLAQDLGEAVGSAACMSELVRTQQAWFELGKNVVEYDQILESEQVWGPQVEAAIHKDAPK